MPGILTMKLDRIANVIVQQRPMYHGDVISIQLEVKKFSKEEGQDAIPAYNPAHLSLVKFALYILHPPATTARARVVAGEPSTGPRRGAGSTENAGGQRHGSAAGQV